MTDENEKPAVYDGTSKAIRVRMEIWGYDDPSHRPAFEAMVNLTLAVASSLKDHPESAYAIGQCLMAAVDVIHKIHNTFAWRGGKKEMTQ